VAVKRSLAATRREIRRRRKVMKSRERKLGKRARQLAGYLLVWTSLPASEMTARQVLSAYRHRWQLELVFKSVCEKPSQPGFKRWSMRLIIEMWIIASLFSVRPS
jgi:hypothetical protein